LYLDLVDRWKLRWKVGNGRRKTEFSETLQVMSQESRWKKLYADKKSTISWSTIIPITNNEWLKTNTNDW